MAGRLTITKNRNLTEEENEAVEQAGRLTITKKKEESAKPALSSPAAPLSGGKKFRAADVVGKYQDTHGDNEILSQDPRYKMRFTNVALEQQKRDAVDDALEELLGRQQTAQREMEFFDSGEFKGPSYLAAEQLYNQIQQQIDEENRKAMTQQQIDEVKAFQEMERWQSATGRKGFADAAAYKKNDDLKYNVINRDPEAVAKSHEEAAKYNLDIAGVDMGHLEKMTDEEIGLYNYYYSTVGPEKADEYLASIESDLKARRMGARREWYREYAEQNPVAASAFSVLTSPARGLSYVGQAADYLKGGKMDANESYNIFARAGSDIRGQVSSDIEKNVEGFWGKAGSFAYNTGMSMGDFLMAAGLSGGVGGVATTIMGTGAAAQTVLDAKDRGLDDNQAFALGTIAGVAEALTEKFSIEALLDRTAMGKGALTYILKNAITEGSEEAASGIINTVADILISKDKSEWSQSVEDYMSQGMSEKEAFWRAVADQAKNIGLDALGGMLSGGLVGSVGATGNVLATEMGIGKNGAEVAQQAGITPENIGAFTANYEAGKDGKTFEEVKTVQTGIDENTARQAFNAGQMDAIAEGNTEQEVNKNEERNESGRNGSERQIGMAPAERSGSVPEGTGSVAERRETRRLRAEEIRRAVEASGQVSTSAAAQGIAEGTSKNTMKLVPAKLWTDGIRQMVHRQSAKGVQVIPFVGEMEFRDKGGTYTARGAVSRDGKRMWVCVDDLDVDFPQIEKHEDFHIAVKRDKKLLENTRKAIVEKYDETRLKKLVSEYVEFYGWGDLDTDYILEEILADAYAEINVFDFIESNNGAAEFSKVVQESISSSQESGIGTVEDVADRFSFKGYDPETGRGIYESNFPKGTPKAAKAQKILNYIQNVWSKKPIRLVVKKPGEAPREILAQFDPTYDPGENVLTDASKLMGGNRHGNASEQRVTLDLADDYYQIASEASYNGFKKETGKDSPTHNNVKEWHYFVNDILFQEYGETEAAPYRVTINVKERSDGSFVYSFNAEREDKRPSTRRTLHADVNQSATSGEANAQPSVTSIDEIEPAVNGKSSRKATPEQIAAFIEKYGVIEPGENPSREIQVPRKTGENKNVSKTVRTILEAQATPEAAIPTIEQMVANGELSYETISDKQAIADAQAKLTNKGWSKTLSKWLEEAKTGTVSKDHTVTGWALYNNAANAGDLDTAMTVLEEMVKSQRNAAQALQATRVLKKLSPEAQLYAAQRSVEDLQEEINERYGSAKAPQISIDPALAEAFLTAKTEDARTAAMAEIYKDVGRQMPSTFRDKWNAWRYLAMLGNPRTHVRNIVGNAGFAPIVAAKNLTATAIEKAVNVVSGGKTGRSKAIIGTGKADRAILKAAWGDFAKVQDQIMSGGKYSDFQMASQAIEEGRRIFKNKALEAARRGNTRAMEAEDAWFSKPHYAYALAGYCKANGITPEMIEKGASIETARAYAIREAQKATYRDTNAFSQMVSDLGKVNKNEKNIVKKGVGVVLQGILPFRKTPANILVRGVEYSPIGLMKAISADAYKVAKGDMSATEMIDNLSAGLTGTGLMAMGAFLAAQGLIRGHGPDDEKKEFEELQGHQAYSLEIGDTSITLDWLAPECLPFFVGVNLYEQSVAEGEDVTMSTILTAIQNVSEPMLEMSCLQSLNDVFDAVGYASSNDLAALPSILASAATSYLTQGLPTLLGQAERSGQDVRYTTYTTKDSFLTSDMQYTLGSASARIPGWDFQQIPYIDAWGRQESSGGVVGRSFNNFLNPSYTSTITNSKMEDELMRLYDETGEGSVFPTRAQRSFPVGGETKYLTADEYVKYATQKGQVSYELVSKLVDSKVYDRMSEEERVDAVSDAYSLANVIAKHAVSDYTTNGWMQKAVDAKKRVGLDYSKYLEVRLTVSDIESLKDENGESIGNSKGLQIMEAIYNMKGLNDKQRLQLFEDFGVGKTIINLNKAAVEAKLKNMR